MRNFTRVSGLTTALLVAFFGVAVSSASASTSVVSTDPVHAEQFSFYCQPYLFSFEAGNHYMPQSGHCTYSIPSTITNTKVIALYRGVPGNSVQQSGESFSNPSATLVRQSPNVFSSPVQDEDYFAVIYDIALDGGSDLFDIWLRTGGEPPAGAVESGNYYLLPWKWGPKVAGEFDPIILVPDILTTWQTDSGSLLDPIFNIYTNLIDTFEASGYVENQTLFIFPYDWENSNMESAAALQDKIGSVKDICNCSQVDIIGHGMGGLIATQYIQSSAYENDVDQLLTLGVPLLGVPSAYLAWEGGEVAFGNPLQDGLAQALLSSKAQAEGQANVYEYVQATPVSSFLELTPVFFDYISGASYPTGYPQNTFLETVVLEVSESFFVNPLARLHTILADDGEFDTVIGFDVEPSSEPPKWPDGQPISTQTDAGDSMVPRTSIENILGAADQEFSVAHEVLPTAAQSHAFTALNGAPPSTVVNNSYPTSCVLFLTVSPGSDLQITDPNALRLGKNFGGGSDFAEISRSVYSGPNAAAEYLALANPIGGVYQVRAQGNVSGSFTLTASDVCDDSTHSTSTTGTMTPGQILGFSVTVADDDSLSIESLDSGSPVVIINTPAQGAVYLTTGTVLTSVTITDPESSPIVQTIYTLNSTPINHLNPLPLSSQPLGPAQFVVAATDVFGNTGYATSTFTIEAPPAPAPTDCVHALSAAATPAVKLSGSAQINANCTMQVNSNTAGAVEINGSSKIITAGNCIVGALKKSGSASMAPAATVPCAAKTDPFANHAKPVVGACTFNNYKVNGSKTETLSPGVYCGGLDIGGSAKVTFSPGIYIIKNGDFIINGSAKASGDGVAFFLTGSSAAFNFGGSADVKLTAPTSGLLKGFVFFLDSASAVAEKSEVNGSAKGWFSGIVYLPKQEFRLSGSVQAPTPTPATTYIADTFQINGSAKLNTSGATTTP